MNNRPDRDSKLLTGAFHDDWADGPAAGFARVAAAHVRRRRALRRTVVVASAAAAAFVATFVARQSPRAPALSRITPAPKAVYEIISDDELIAQLRDRPLLVVRKPDGTKEIRLIEESATADPTRGE
jgi:hypothetical protein